MHKQNVKLDKLWFIFISLIKQMYYVSYNQNNDIHPYFNVEKWLQCRRLFTFLLYFGYNN